LNETFTHIKSLAPEQVRERQRSFASWCWKALTMPDSSGEDTDPLSLISEGHLNYLANTGDIIASQLGGTALAPIKICSPSSSWRIPPCQRAFGDSSADRLWPCWRGSSGTLKSLVKRQVAQGQRSIRSRNSPSMLWRRGKACTLPAQVNGRAAQEAAQAGACPTISRGAFGQSNAREGEPARHLDHEPRFR
jgi:hypothetical protein